MKEGELEFGPYTHEKKNIIIDIAFLKSQTSLSSAICGFVGRKIPNKKNFF